MNEDLTSSGCAEARTARDGSLKYYFGPMDCGKSTLALQINHNLSRRNRRGALLTRLDRSGAPTVSSRLGLSSAALEIDDDTDIRRLVERHGGLSGKLDYLVCDEVQFYSVKQIEQLADLVDDTGVDVYAFGLATDFRSHLFPGSQRLFELADELVRLQVDVLCWCGRPGLLNARVVAGGMAREGAQIVVGDTMDGDTRYEVLCRRHFRSGTVAKLGPTGSASDSLPRR